MTADRQPAAPPLSYDVIIIGAGAAGMMCAIACGKRGRRVLLLDHAASAGEKIRISGGGRCNFTNLHATPAQYLSNNPHFCKSALSRFTQHDFIKMVERHRIAYHEKTLGQLFCDHSAKDILSMLFREMADHGVDLKQGVSIDTVQKDDATGQFGVHAGSTIWSSASLVVATGGLSIPKIGATGFAYDIARQFGIPVIPTRAGLVPLLFDAALLEKTRVLSGLAVDPAVVTCGKTSFREAILLTHKGISGPAILQISSVWQEGMDIIIDLLPGGDTFAYLKEARSSTPRIFLRTALAALLPQRLAEMIAADSGYDAPLADLSDAKFKAIADHIHRWHIRPIGTEGYRTAEVTLGGIDTDAVSSKTFECKKTPGLYFIGECLDVTGHLGGFNFQWAWSSGWCAGQFA
jgi:predicted Rossmann fold flavoprotein